MTLGELNVHRGMVVELRDMCELLESMSALHASSFDGMPRSSPYMWDRTQSVSIKRAKLKSEIDGLQKAVKASEGAVLQFIDSITDNRTNLIFYLRFICGYDWQGVAEVIGGRNTVDAVKSQCYRYLREQSGTFGSQ